MTKNRTFLPAVAVLTTLAAAGPAQALDAGWKDKVSKAIASGYSYPRSAQMRGVEGSAKVKITISGVGKVLSVELVQKTGSEILDREAIRIPTKVGAFPPPPGGASTEVTVPISWQMK